MTTKTTHTGLGDTKQSPEIDRQIAEKVMGWKIDDTEDKQFPLIRRSDDKTDWFELSDWHPSIDEAQAAQVRDRMIADGYGVHIHWHNRALFWDVVFSRDNKSWRIHDWNSLPMAICLAALKCKEDK